MALMANEVPKTNATAVVRPPKPRTSISPESEEGSAVTIKATALSTMAEVKLRTKP